MKKYYLHIIVGMGYFLFVAGSCGEEPEISGCIDSRACNYNIEATIDNGNCILSEDNLDCNGNCIIQTDDGCECAVLYDECGFCDGDNSSCTDCNGDVNGDSILDICEICDNDPSNDCVQDCAGVWGGSLVEDGCGVCGGDSSSCTGCMDDTACNYSLTAIISGECEYVVEGYDCNGNCILEVDCAGVCGGSAIEDVCGICGGGILEVGNCVECPESDPEDCAGICAGSLVEDECGVCDGDNSSCTGCMDDTACNYSLTATIGGECEYVVENYDCNGNCNVEVDCAGVCNGSSVNDECSVCDGNNSTCLDCANIPNGDSFTDNCGECVAAGDISCVQGCNGNYANNGTQVVDDECGICHGDNSTCTDCNGVINGLGFIDYCGHCIESLPALWKIKIVAELALMNSDLDILIDGSTNYLGADILYTDGFDAGIDFIEPPSPPNASLSFSFYHDDWEDAIIGNQQVYYFTKDIRNHNYNDFLNDGKTWNAELKSIENYYNGTAKLTFNFIEGLSDASITVDVIGSNLSGTSYNINDGDSIDGIIMSYNTIVNFDIQISNLCY